MIDTTNIHNNKLLQALEDISQKRGKIATTFEDKESFEMAYLARWSVVEIIVKQIIFTDACISLRPQLVEWIKYIDEPSENPPRAIRFPSEPSKANLPATDELKNRFSRSSNLLDLLNSKEKYRKKRNAIVHSAETFGKLATYEDYKAKVAAATEELQTVLSRPQGG